MKILAVLLMLSSPLIFAKDITPKSKNEIQHLFEYLKGSNCQFNRNGDWYEPNKAADHLNNKYEYLLKKNLVASAEDFIDLAATKSSMSDTAYWVKCADGKPEDSASWFKSELVRFRLTTKK
jgi:Family of unknown function (DUF5329)